MAEASDLPLKIDDETRRIARCFAPDYYLAALLVPQRAQSAAIALAAFQGDVDRIVSGVSEPSLAEIRLQWWRDALRNGLDSENPAGTGSPVADAVISAARTHGLPFDGFDRSLDARILDLYADPLAGDAALEAWIDATVGHALHAIARVIDRKTTDTGPAKALIAVSASAIGRTRLLCATAAFLARGRAPFPGAYPSTDAALRAMVEQRTAETRNTYDTAKLHWRAAPSAARLACLPLGLVPSYLRAVEAHGHDPRRSIASISPLARVWRLWRAWRLGLL